MRALLLCALALSATAVAADFLGPESCKACHPDAYTAWKASKHARAKESLSTQQQKDSRCLSCHSPNEADQHVEQVSCESCHGGGQFYSASYVMKDSELSRLVGLQDPSEKSCRNCHDASSPSLRPFNFVEKLKLIDHWSIEREKRAASADQPPADKSGKKK
ncbi:MAG: multiheme c-type cytochrome [Myxococcaceae bacterium]